MDMKDTISVETYHWRAENVYTPIYPVIANQIIKRFGIIEGSCLDIGCCGGYFGIAMAMLTNLKVILMDIEESALAIANEKISEESLGGRIGTLFGDVHEIPLQDSSVNLVISRSSIHFWDDYAKAFSEIYRVLTPGGAAYVGSGFGTPELKRQISYTMKKIVPSWGTVKPENSPEKRVSRLLYAMKKSGISQYEIINDGSGVWVAIKKPA